MFYVSMTDIFLSGWGSADNRINKLVIECNTYNEAVIVKENAEHRKEMKYVNICSNKPRYNHKSYRTDYHNKTDYSNWFIKDYFKG